jgi:hypothetical protein
MFLGVKSGAILTVPAATSFAAPMLAPLEAPAVVAKPGRLGACG